MSSISTDWSIQSISIKSDLPIFIDWLLRGWHQTGVIAVIAWQHERREKGEGIGERGKGALPFSPPPLPFLAPATGSSPYVDNLRSLSLPVTTSSPGRFSLALEVPLSNQSQRKAPWGRGWSHHAMFLQRGSIEDELVETKNLFILVALRPLRTVCHFSVHTIRTDGNMNCRTVIVPEYWTALTGRKKGWL